MGAVGYTGGDPEKVDVAGDTMTGPLVLPGDPSLDLQAATKQYVDNHSGGGGGGGTPATTVTSETSFGITPVVGIGTKYARDDHTHGSPPTPTKASVGLGNVDNTSDASKPVSTAQGNADNAVANAAASALSTHVSATTNVHGIPDTAALATTSSVANRVVGPASATDNAVVRFDTTTGKLAQNSLLLVNDDGSMVLTPIGSLAYAAGLLAYDSANQCLTFFNNDANVSMQIGQELWLKVRNVSGSSIANGTPVYISGADSGVPTIAPANANAIGTVPAVGLTTEAIANNANGYVTIAGVVNGIDTSAMAAGAQLYVGTTAGALVTTAPSSPNFRNRVGSVMSVNATTGQILVTPGAAVLGAGTANQVLGMNAGATAQEYKTINGTASQITVTHAVNSVTLALAAALFASTTPAAIVIAGAAAAGSGTTLSRADHAHAGPGFGVVSAETSFGIAAANGAALTVARSDHTHGTPSAPTASSVGAIAATLVDAKGDVLTATANDTPARLAVGADGTFLKADSSQATGLIWATPTVTGGGGSGVPDSSRAYPKTGWWYRAPGSGPVGANLTMVQNRLYLVPFRVGLSFTADRIGADVATVGAAGAVIRLGIWQADATNYLPGTLVLDAGTVQADTGTGSRTITIAQALPVGVYWLGVVMQVASGVLLRATVNYDPLLPYFTGINAITGTESAASIITNGVSSTLASTPVPTDNDRGPLLSLRSV